MIELVFIKGIDSHGDLCLIPIDCVAWISRVDKNDTPDIFGTHDGEVYTCEGGWQQAVEMYSLGRDEDGENGTEPERGLLN